MHFMQNINLFYYKGKQVKKVRKLGPPVPPASHPCEKLSNYVLHNYHCGEAEHLRDILG